MLKQACGSLFSASTRLFRLSAENVLSRPAIINNVLSKTVQQNLDTCRFYSTFMSSRVNTTNEILNRNTCIVPSNVLNFNVQPNRGLTKFSLKKGKRKTVKTVVDRFYRLAWGIWIRTKCGRSKKLWKKPAARKRRLRQHVFCNAKQSTLLDKMTTKYWKKRRYYPDDPYEPYHSREEFPFTRKNPLPE
ncbi:39S ribosomal protein L35, mitochondrial isoform X2 [Adelges cooleyi]|uniref:39S ribosomal protein L35, mitochondrial isoform X2 n=1 Tax=Adelges cooleyi TaxID=133065 RepID=UPI00217F503E|nr:39S ribosomal protein L35, mitochondrial isoform X2 [Adelges cooleyi]